jgi:hypothetical protein
LISACNLWHCHYYRYICKYKDRIHVRQTSWQMVHNDRRLGKVIHRDSADFAYIRKQENVDHGLTIVPYLSQVGEVANMSESWCPPLASAGIMWVLWRILASMSASLNQRWLKRTVPFWCNMVRTVGIQYSTVQNGFLGFQILNSKIRADFLLIACPLVALFFWHNGILPWFLRFWHQNHTTGWEWLTFLVFVVEYFGTDAYFGCQICFKNTNSATTLKSSPAQFVHTCALRSTTLYSVRHILKSVPKISERLRVRARFHPKNSATGGGLRALGCRARW